ncbi:MAG: carbohydrate-binding domain-containing protein [Bacteroidales bacterium]|nr:carbohydrate-binding domain-containing protein [Bacteroidales bacterium]
MRKIFAFFVASILFCGILSAQEQRVIFYNGANPIYNQLMENIDSVSFINNVSIVHNNLEENNFQFPVIGIDSIVFTTSMPVVDTGEIIYITYNGNSVSVVNPWANRGVTVTDIGADVTVNSVANTQDIIYCVSGTTSDGSLVINSDRRLNMILRGANITNPTGAAIKLNDDVKISITLEGNSSLTDGGDANSHKATLESEGQIVFSGDGRLSVTGTVKHAIFSNDYIRILSGNFQIPSAVTDGFHADYFQMYTGSIDIDNAKTGIDGDRGFIEIVGGTIDINVSAADGKAMKCDSTVLINGGDITLTLSGAQSKGIKSGQHITLNGGTTTINGSGATIVTDNDPSHCTGLKSDGDVTVNAGNLAVTMSAAAAGGKGINADGSVFFNGGTVNLSVAGNGGNYTNTSNQSDSYTASCVKSNGNIEVNSSTGNTHITLSVSGTEGRGFSADNAVSINGGEVEATLTGNASKGIKADVAMLIAGGTLTINANGSTVVTSGDPAYCTGIKSSGTLNVTGGTAHITCGSGNTGGRCISATGDLTIGGGNLTLKTQGSGTTYTSGNTTDGYGPVCMTTDGDFVVTAGVIDCQSSGTGGRGIKVGGNTTIGVVGGDNDIIDIDIMTSGAPVGGSGGGGGGGWPPGGGGSSTNYCKPKGLKCMGNITINSGHISSYCAQTSGDPTGEAIESKAKITINGGFVEANAYDDAINSAAGFLVTCGYVWAYARGNDGIDNNGTSVAQATNLTGGVIIAAGTEEAIDANTDRGGTFYINGATVIGFYVGNNGMGVFDNPNYQNGQKYVAPFGSSGNATANTAYCLKNSGGDAVMIYRHPSVSGSGFMSDTEGLRPPPGGGGNKFLFTSHEITSGTYTLYTNPTINGTANWHGLYIGATATTSGSGTSVTAQ